MVPMKQSALNKLSKECDIIDEKGSMTHRALKSQRSKMAAIYCIYIIMKTMHIGA